MGNNPTARSIIVLRIDQVKDRLKRQVIRFQFARVDKNFYFPVRRAVYADFRHAFYPLQLILDNVNCDFTDFTAFAGL